VGTAADVPIEELHRCPCHPATAALVIEVAVSSLRRDFGLKSALYAAAGVLEYWVVDLDGERIVVHRQPRDDGYAEIEERAAGATLQAASVALPALDVGELLGSAGE
jgi:Uma2 family endonuclease